MDSAINQFRANIERVQLLSGLYSALYSLTTPVVDASDILRSQIVLTASALDHYIHELTRLGMLEVYNGSRPVTHHYLRFQTNIESTLAALSAGGGVEWLDTAIREKHRYLSFQHPEKIADAIRLFSSIEVWPSVAAKLGLPVKEIKDSIILIIERRNKISHEADLDPSYPGVRWPISLDDVEKATEFIKNVCEAIHSFVV